MFVTENKIPIFDLFESLLVHDKAQDLMSSPPITLSQEATMTQAKDLMRDHRISGIPIVDEEGKLVGLISIENIIIGLENSHMEDPIKEHMEKEVVYLGEDMDVSMVVEHLMTYSFGRYPVTDKEKKVVGVITNGDVILHILERLGNVYFHDKRREEILTPGKYLLRPEHMAGERYFSFSIESTDIDRAGEGASMFKKFLKQLNLPKPLIRRASIALYEAEVNVVIHAGGQGRIKAYVKDDQIFIIITDKGPGIDDIELAMQPGYTTASDEIRSRGFGAGMGLANIKKYTDKVVILSSENGVNMEMVLVANDNERSAN